jgi:hypothetical protein
MLVPSVDASSTTTISYSSFRAPAAACKAPSVRAIRHSLLWDGTINEIMG